MNEPISITSLASISALGTTLQEIWKNYLSNSHFLTKKKFVNTTAWVAQLTEKDSQFIQKIRDENNKYKNLDNAVLYAIYCGRKAVEKAGWKPSDNFGINIGSSRGATSLFEKYHKQFLTKKTVPPLSSPTTTLGNISSWVAHDLQTSGPLISHSITCSTALHALLNGIAWIHSGMATKFLVGGSEAPLTDFTIAQMQALKVYTDNGVDPSFPCKAFNLQKKYNTMVLGEGAAAVCLEKGVQENALVSIIGVGFATEILQHNTSISSKGVCFQESMKMALGTLPPEKIDAIVMHAPGTIKGDLAEVKAIENIFKDKTPFLTTNKWKLGHTFGASGMLNLELAILMLQHQKVIPVPFVRQQASPKLLKNIMVNAVGFGGNAVSILLTK